MDICETPTTEVGKCKSFCGAPLTRDLFLRHIETLLHYWERAYDEEDGGFYNSIEANGEVVVGPWSGKSLVMQSRLLYNYSEGIRFGFDFASAYAERQYEYLIKKMKTPGGWYLSYYKGRHGPPADLMITYSNLFVVIGLSRYAQATGCKEALDEAWRLLCFIEDKTISGELAENGLLGAWGEIPEDSHFSRNKHFGYSGDTILHYLEALACLQAAGISEDIESRVRDMRKLFLKYFVSEDPLCVYEEFDDSLKTPYTGPGAVFSMGHALEWIDFFRCFPGYELPEELERKILDFSAQEGVMDNGLFMDKYYLNEKKVAGFCFFWPQVEATKTFYLGANLYGGSYVDTFKKLARGYFDIMVDSDGGVFDMIDRNGVVVSRKKGHHYKCDYHSIRMCVGILDSKDGILS